jgi:hypothetical protein
MHRGATASRSSASSAFIEATATSTGVIGGVVGVDDVVGNVVADMSSSSRFVYWWLVLKTR